MVGVGLLAWTAYARRALPLKGLLLVRPRGEAAICCRASSCYLLPPRAHPRHNVIHQNGPFSGPRAAFLSVAALNMDDTTFSMSSNVIIFIVKLRPVPSCTSPSASHLAKRGGAYHRPPSTVYRPPPGTAATPQQ